MNPNFANALAKNPNAFLYGALMVPTMAVASIFLIHWVIDGELTIYEFLITVGLFFWLTAVCIAPPFDWMSPIIFGGVVIGCLSWPFLRLVKNNRELKQIDIDALENDMDHLTKFPRDFVRQMRFARRLNELGVKAHAIAIGHVAVQQMPQAAITSEKREIQSWQNLAMPQELKQFSCVRCGTTPDIHMILCPQCGAPYLLEHFRRTGKKSDDIRRVYLGFAIGIGVLLLLISLSVSGPTGQLVGIPVVLLLGSLMMWRLLRRSPATA